MICHRCWNEFDTCRLLSIAESPMLAGDPVLGPEAMLRFCASHFDVDGNAIDPEGSSCREFACPRCRLPIPRAIIDREPVLLSLVGVPAAGKSFLLATATWSLRQLSNRLPVSCIDPDPVANALLHQAEARLFHPARSGDLVSLEKTDVAGEQRYDNTQIGSERVDLLRPFVLALEPTDKSKQPLTLVLYDNAGEHFLPSDARSSAQATGHLRRSAAAIVLIDPIQHPTMREACSQTDPQVAQQRERDSPPPRQELLIAQAASSIRKMRGLRDNKTIQIPLVIAVGKADAWIHNIPEAVREKPLLIESETGMRLDHDAIEKMSTAVRAFVEQHAPEIIGAIKSLGSQAIFLPVTATGQAPTANGADSDFGLGVRAGELSPRWVAECILSAVDLARPGALFPERTQKVDEEVKESELGVTEDGV